MKLKIASRIFNEEYFIDFFLDYYIKIGADEIHIFDGDSDDNTLDIIHLWTQKNNNIKIILSDKKHR